jgi:putative ABC transport system permease protein
VWRATLKGLLAHKIRLLLTVVAIMVGTGFVSGSYVFTDTLGGIFDDLFADAFAGTDVVVQAEVDDELSFQGRGRFDPGVVDEVRAVEGVAAAEGTITGFVNLASPDGELLGGQGPPTIASAWIETGNPFSVIEGRVPASDGELALDRASARRFRLELDAPVQLLALGRPEEFTVVGYIGLGSSDGFGGATAVALTPEAADRVFAAEGRIDTINVVAEEGTTPERLVEAIQPVLPEGIEAIDARLAAEEQLEGFKEALGFINTFILVFGLVALFAAAFLIQNTFQIIVTQRTKELALLRAVGATRRQVLGMVLGEATIVSIVAAGLGVLLGVGLATLIRLAFETFGGDIPAGELTVRPRTIGVALATGLVVTVLSALSPALSASRIPPVAAMREAFAPPRQRSLTRRATLGTVLTVLGGGLLFTGLRVELPTDAVSEISLVGAGAALIFVGIAVLGPLLARPVGRSIGAPVAASGTVGTIARENSVRSPRRTAATASSIMIGTALAGLALILGSSLDVTTDNLIADRFRSDLIVQPGGFGGAQISPSLSTELQELPEVAGVAPIRQGVAEVNGTGLFLGAADMARLVGLVRFEVAAGDLAGLGDTELAVSDELAAELAVGVGDEVTMTFAAGGEQPFTIGAVYVPVGPGADGYITRAAWDANFTERFDSAVFVDLANDVDLATGRSAVTTVADTYPGAVVLDQNQFADEARSQIRQILGLVFALLALTLLIGFVGILNTLLLSIIERTREIGLLRAVGTTRRQLSAMITWEAVIVAVFGALLGIGLGIFFGWAVVSSLQRDSELVLSIPALSLATAVMVAAVAGIFAAVYPGWRASRLNVLAAIAYE